MNSPARRRRHQDATPESQTPPPREPDAAPAEGEDQHEFAQRQSRDLQQWVNAAEPSDHDREQNFLLTPQQKARLRKQLPASLIGTIEGPDGEEIHYVPAHVVDLLAMTIFGDQWSSQVMEVRELYQGPNSKPTMQQTHLIIRHAARVRVTVTGPDGTSQSHEAGAVCSCAARIGDLEEMDDAWQTSYQGAITLARRNAISLFGEIFGGILMRDRDGIVAAARRNREARREAQRRNNEIPPHAPADAEPVGPVRTVSSPGNKRRGTGAANKAANGPTGRTVHTPQLSVHNTGKTVANESTPAEGTHQLVSPDGSDLGRMTPGVFENTFGQLLGETRSENDVVELAGANDETIAGLPDPIRQRLEQAIESRMLQLQGAGEPAEPADSTATGAGSADGNTATDDTSPAKTAEKPAAQPVASRRKQSDARPDPAASRNAYQSWVLKQLAGCIRTSEIDQLMTDEAEGIAQLSKTGQKVVNRCADSRRDELASQSDS